ncbi:MAG: hypothetical protein NWE93_09455 [Candidatus Bathyarchaeota archaeon]|nr:hypothetical protein [Candidatus Bathyarchaeota archaeon]
MYISIFTPYSVFYGLWASDISWRIANFKYASNYTPSHTGVLWVLVVQTVRHDDLPELYFSAITVSSKKDATPDQNLVFPLKISQSNRYFCLPHIQNACSTPENAAQYGEF